MSNQEKTLTQICKENGIGKRALTEDEMAKYRNNHPRSDKVLNSMLDISEKLNGNVIVIGGFCVHPKLLGFRKMRRLSNDLDCITNEKGIKTLHENFKNELFQTENYGDLFMEYRGLPFSFDVNETHEWKIPKDFYSESREFNIKDIPLNTISPEYLITLKSRRALHKGRVFGKDKLDTANVILAPYFKEHPENEKTKYVNLEKTASLIRQHSFDNYYDVIRYADSLKKSRDHLKKSEREIFSENISKLKKHLKKEYSLKL